MADCLEGKLIVPEGCFHNIFHVVILILEGFLLFLLPIHEHSLLNYLISVPCFCVA